MFVQISPSRNLVLLNFGIEFMLHKLKVVHVVLVVTIVTTILVEVLIKLGWQLVFYSLQLLCCWCSDRNLNLI